MNKKDHLVNEGFEMSLDNNLAKMEPCKDVESIQHSVVLENPSIAERFLMAF